MDEFCAFEKALFEICLPDNKQWKKKEKSIEFGKQILNRVHNFQNIVFKNYPWTKTTELERLFWIDQFLSLHVRDSSNIQNQYDYEPLNNVKIGKISLNLFGFNEELINCVVYLVKNERYQTLTLNICNATQESNDIDWLKYIKLRYLC